MKGDTDIPMRLLSAVVNRMPEDRREWGQAMVAELAHLPGSAARWRFSISCLRVALLPPDRFESLVTTMIKNCAPVIGVMVLPCLLLLHPEIGGAVLAWACTIYGIVVVAIPTGLFGNVLVMAAVAWAVCGQARGRSPWPRSNRLRKWGRLGVEVVFGLVNPVLYLSILTSAFALQPSGSEWWIEPANAVAWVLLIGFWTARVGGAAFKPGSRVIRTGIRALLLASMACLLLFTAKDVWRLFDTTADQASLTTLLITLIRFSPLYVIPALLLWYYLHSVSGRAGSEASDGSPGGFFLLPDRAARLAVAGIIGLSLITYGFAAHRRSDSNVRNLVQAHRASIHGAAARYGVEPRLIAAIVYVTHREQLSPFRDAVERLIINTWAIRIQKRGPGNERSDESPLLNVALDISVGLTQIKPRTAQTASILATGHTPDTLPKPEIYAYRQVEPVGDGWPTEVAEQLVMNSPIPVPSERGQVAQMLLSSESNLQTCALILALYQKQWEATNKEWSIRNKPEILATLYQIGFSRSNPHGTPKSNEFGERVRQVFEQPWLSELMNTNAVRRVALR